MLHKPFAVELPRAGRRAEGSRSAFRWRSRVRQSGGLRFSGGASADWAPNGARRRSLSHASPRRAWRQAQAHIRKYIGVAAKEAEQRLAAPATQLPAPAPGAPNADMASLLHFALGKPKASASRGSSRLTPTHRVCFSGGRKAAPCGPGCCTSEDHFGGSRCTALASEQSGATVAGAAARVFGFCCAQVDWLLAEIGKQKARGIANPFVAVDLRRFVPSWAAHGVRVPDEHKEGPWQGLAEAMKGGPTSEGGETGLLPWNQWHASFEMYAIAAAAVEQLSLAALVAHKQIVLQVGAAQLCLSRPARRASIA